MELVKMNLQIPKSTERRFRDYVKREKERRPLGCTFQDILYEALEKYLDENLDNKEKAGCK
jgi:hypothetical protein